MTAATANSVTCPFCGLVCDDLSVAPGPAGLDVRANGCALALRGFTRPAAPGIPRIAGRATTLVEAAAEAARLLGRARRPLFGGLGTDVAGARAAGRLADRTGGVLDHMNGAGAVRNLLVLQDGGWITTTLSEIRNRCDLLLCAGGDITSRFPRFFERTIAARDTLFGSDRRCEVVFLGRGPQAGVTLDAPVEVIGCEVGELGQAFGLLRALLAGRPVQASAAAGTPIAIWHKLAERLRAAKYGVVVWAAPDFDFPHAELAIQSLCELVKDLNRETRFSGLPLGGSDGDITADAVALWQTGFGLRADFGRGEPTQDLHLNGTQRLLASGEADLLLWISSFDPARLPPAGSTPTVVLGHPAMALPREPAVFIPVGTPGVDHAGHLFRADRVVALPLAQLRRSELPSVADALAAIEAALAGAG
jgi:formylmethanofuran dehydrogenase subunit B